MSAIFEMQDLDGSLSDSGGSIYIPPIIVGATPYTQIITLTPGWNMISTCIDLTTLSSDSDGGGSVDIADILAHLTPAGTDYLDSNPYNPYVIIMKDNEGIAYIPEWGFNGIGDWSNGKGYQVKLIANDNTQENNRTITLKGRKLGVDVSGAPQDILIDLAEGWNMIEQPFSGGVSVTSFFGGETTTGEPVIDLINLVKNLSGSVWMPEFDFNGIGTMQEGQGYMVHTSEAFSMNVNRTLMYDPVAPDDVIITDDSIDVDDEVTDATASVVFSINTIKSFLDSLNEPPHITDIRSSLILKYSIINNPNWGSVLRASKNHITFFEELEASYDKDSLARTLVKEFNEQYAETPIDRTIIIKDSSGGIIGATTTFTKNKDTSGTYVVGLPYISNQSIFVYLHDTRSGEFQLEPTLDSGTFEIRLNKIINVTSLELSEGVSYGVSGGDK